MEGAVSTLSRSATAVVRSYAHPFKRAVSTATTSILDLERTTEKSPDRAGPAALPKETKAKSRKKTMAQIDEELRLAMEGRAGDGGESGMELEDGKPVSMKRGVKENMFRYI